MHKIKITQLGWDGFNGHLCQVEFVDGVSVHPVVQPMADRVAAIVECQILDENGEHAGQAGYAARHPAGVTIGAPVANLDVLTQEQLDAERKAAIDKELKNPASKIFTADELEKIASTGGINGLRAQVGDKWGVKERSISKLIVLILQAQAEYLSRKDERDATEKVAKEAAEAEAIEKAAKERAEFDAKCRGVLNKDELTGTVDPAKVPTNEWDGENPDPMQNFIDAIKSASEEEPS